MPFLIAFTLTTLAAGLPAAVRAQSAPGDPSTILPLEVGNRWTYVGTVRGSEPDSGEMYEDHVTWTMRVVDAFDRSDLRVAIVTGHPADLAWGSGETEPARSIVIRAGEEAFYLVRGPRVGEVERRLRDGSDGLISLVRETDLFLHLPLRKGKRFCEADQRLRPDFFYCWLVESIDADGSVRVTHRTIGDHRIIEYEPDVGIVSYVWGHHGSPGDVALELVDFTPGPDAGSSR